MTRQVSELLDQIGQYVLFYPEIQILPFDDGERGEIGYRANSEVNPARWVFRFRDLQNFYKSDDPRVGQVRTYLSTPTGRQHLPTLLSEMLKPIEPEPVFFGPHKTRFHIMEEMCS